MNDQTTDFERLAERILNDRTGQLTAPELDALLTWLAGGERRGAGVLIQQLGPAGEQPQLLRQVYEDLDDALFSPDGLELEAAFVSAREEDSVRKARYRRLMNAFHPDRFADHADWLTSRSQFIHAAYQAYRRAEPVASTIATATPTAETGSYKPRNPRGSARLTPAEPGPLRRLRWRLRNVENLQAKILGGLAALTLVPLLLIYLLDPAPTSRPGAAIENPSPQARPAETATAAQPETPTQGIQTAPTLAQTRQTPTPPEPGTWNPEPETRDPEPENRNPGPQTPNNVTPGLTRGLNPESRGPNNVTQDPNPVTPGLTRGPNPEPQDPILAEALAARMDLSETRFEPPQGLKEFRLPDPQSTPKVQPTPEPLPTPKPQPTPERDPTPEPKPTRESESTPEPGNPNPETRTPNPEPQTPNNVTPGLTRDPNPEPAPTTESEPARQPQPTVEPAIPNPEPQTPNNVTPGLTRGPNPEPAPAPEPTEEPELPNPETGTQNPEPRTPNPEPDPIETRVATLLSAYESAFTQGNIDAFMAVLTANPRENRNRGRDWFRSSYRRLFTESTSRRLEVTVARIEPVPSGWQVTALFELWVAYPDRRATHAEQLIRYTLEADPDGQLRIAAIDY